MNETLQTIKARRSVRAYTEQQVSAEDLNLILEAATYAPSGMHLETWHFTAIQNKEVLEELNDKIKGAFAKSDDLHTRERGHSQTYCCYYHAPGQVVGRYGLCLRLGEHFSCSQVPRHRFLLD